MNQTVPSAGLENPLTPAQLGFEEIKAPEKTNDPPAWRMELGGRTVTFRLLRSVEELSAAETLQRDVFGVTDLDLIPAGELAIVHETGGEVIAAFVREAGSERAVGCLFGWGGFFERRARIVSDFMAVRLEFRSSGIGAAMKRLQAALALERGFEEIVWTVDPLRAANARLNFEKLGAHCNHYEENRYGKGYGETLYGGLPSDRLHVTWPIADASIQQHLLRQPRPRTVSDLAGIEVFDPDQPNVDRALIYIPNDIDGILAADREAALEWRFRLRSQLPRAFAAGLAITGFVTNADPSRELAAYLVQRSERNDA
jgi:predicted GNAT superfamily acetyltransferase